MDYKNSTTQSWIPHDPVGFLKWMIGFIVLLFIVWLIFGGPERFEEERPGPFIEELPPIDTGETYGP